MRFRISSREHPIFNDRRRKVFRKHISNDEIAFFILFVFISAAIGAWFASKRADFDPRERDVSTAVLKKDEVVDTLYRKPLQRWVDPAKSGGSGGSKLPDLTPFPPVILDGGWQLSSRLEHFDPSTL